MKTKENSQNTECFLLKQLRCWTRSSLFFQTDIKPSRWWTRVTALLSLYKGCSRFTDALKESVKARKALHLPVYFFSHNLHPRFWSLLRIFFAEDLNIIPVSWRDLFPLLERFGFNFLLSFISIYLQFYLWFNPKLGARSQIIPPTICFNPTTIQQQRLQIVALPSLRETNFLIIS